MMMPEVIQLGASSVQASLTTTPSETAWPSMEGSQSNPRAATWVLLAVEDDADVVFLPGFTGDTITGTSGALLPRKGVPFIVNVRGTTHCIARTVTGTAELHITPLANDKPIQLDALQVGGDSTAGTAAVAGTDIDLPLLDTHPSIPTTRLPTWVSVAVEGAVNVTCRPGVVAGGHDAYADMVLLPQNGIPTILNVAGGGDKLKVRTASGTGEVHITPLSNQ